MAATPGVAQADGGEGIVHARIIAQWPDGSRIWACREAWICGMARQ
jgi:hypothetical protein